MNQREYDELEGALRAQLNKRPKLTYGRTPSPTFVEGYRAGLKQAMSVVHGQQQLFRTEKEGVDA